MNTREEISKQRKKEEIKERRKENRRKLRRRLKLFIWLIVLTIILTVVYARYIEPYKLVVKEYLIATKKDISENYNGLKIVHFSDLHYGSVIKEKELIKVVNKINELKPDLVFFTGDLVDNKYKMKKDDAVILKKYLSMIKSNLGNYAIYGNHDLANKYYEDIIKDSNFILLDNNYELIYNKDNDPILVYGLEDALLQTPSLQKYTDDLNNYKYKIILIHEPDYIYEFINNYNFDLILSGHSHNGQVKIPFIRPLYLPKGCKKLYSPYYKINNSDIYISSGIGTSLLKLRFNNTPSINVYRLWKK